MGLVARHLSTRYIGAMMFPQATANFAVSLLGWAPLRVLPLLRAPLLPLGLLLALPAQK